MSFEGINCTINVCVFSVIACVPYFSFLACRGIDVKRCSFLQFCIIFLELSILSSEDFLIALKVMQLITLDIYDLYS